ncbi:MAG: hypothetical protein ACO1OT_14660, partial [Heyndrickxia sp.]
MKKEGIIEFKSFEEKVNLIQQDTKNKQQFLNERIKELMEDVPIQTNVNGSNKRASESKKTSCVNVSFQREREIITQIQEHSKEISEIKEVILNRKIGMKNMVYRFYHSIFKV